MAKEEKLQSTAGDKQVLRRLSAEVEPKGRGEDEREAYIVRLRSFMLAGRRNALVEPGRRRRRQGLEQLSRCGQTAHLLRRWRDPQNSREGQSCNRTLYHNCGGGDVQA